MPQRGRGNSRTRGQRGGGRLTVETSLRATAQSNHQRSQASKTEFKIAPLILEGVTTNKIELNKFLQTHFAELKMTDIQANRAGSFTLYATDVKSFNRLLTELPIILADNGHQQATVYIPRTIQRILDTDKDAFVKYVDLDIKVEEIQTSLKENGFSAVNIVRISNKDNNGPSRTIKISFTDVQNRDTFSQVGLQIGFLHFPVERAIQKNKPPQCFICLQYGHVAKYCKSQQQVCARCGNDHRLDQCPNENQVPQCLNCKGNHFATSTDCSKFKEHQQRLQKTIDQYSTSINYQKTVPNMNNLDDFPTLPNPSHKDHSQIEREQEQTIEHLTETITTIVEKATERIFDFFSRKFELLTKSIYTRLNIPNDEISDEDVDENDDQTAEKEVHDVKLKQQNQGAKSPQHEHMTRQATNVVSRSKQKKNHGKITIPSIAKQRKPESLNSQSDNAN
jgi:hypothetical protein